MINFLDVINWSYPSIMKILGNWNDWHICLRDIILIVWWGLWDNWSYQLLYNAYHIFYFMQMGRRFHFSACIFMKLQWRVPFNFFWIDHPWIQNAKKAPNVPLGDIVRARLRQFSVMNRFKKKALRVSISHYNPPS